MPIQMQNSTIISSSSNRRVNPVRTPLARLRRVHGESIPVYNKNREVINYRTRYFLDGKTIWVLEEDLECVNNSEWELVLTPWNSERLSWRANFFEVEDEKSTASASSRLRRGHREPVPVCDSDGNIISYDYWFFDGSKIIRVLKEDLECVNDPKWELVLMLSTEGLSWRAYFFEVEEEKSVASISLSQLRRGHRKPISVKSGSITSYYHWYFDGSKIIMVLEEDLECVNNSEWELVLTPWNSRKLKWKAKFKEVE